MTLGHRGTVRLLSFALLACCFADATISAGATPPQASAARDKIDAWVIERTSGGKEAEFLVVLAERADLSHARRLPDKKAKTRFVRDALYARALSAQASLLAWLRARGIDHQSFYLVNAVRVRGTAGIAEAIAARPEVARIEGNPTIRNLQPVTLTPEEIDEAAQKTLAPQAIEPGVTYIHAPEVWAMGYTGQGIVVGSADTGVDWDHPALLNRYRGWNGSSASHDYNWHDSIHSGGGVCGANATAPCDDAGHGTHTTGTTVGSDGGANQIGVAPGAKFIACRNMDQGDGTPARYIECMEWFLAPYPVGGTTAQGDPDLAADVTINSWGCPPSEGCLPGTLQMAIEAQRAAGILFVAAAGNSGPTCSSVADPPGIYDAAYTVGAFSSSTGAIASFSSRGPVVIDGSNRIKPDISAPGVSVRSSVPGNGYSSASGTSMATPHTAGAIALLWSANPSLKNQIDQTESILDQAAVDVNTTSCSSSGLPNNVYGWGRLDIKAAVDLASVAVDPIPSEQARGVWLSHALPNPAHRSTLLRVRLERAGEVDLAIFSGSGQRVRTLFRGEQAAGEHAFRWDGSNDRGAAVGAGVYLVQIESRDQVASRKVIWLGQ